MLIRDLSHKLDTETMAAVRGGDNEDIYVFPPFLPPGVEPVHLGSIWNPVALFPPISSFLHPIAEIVDPNNPLLQ